MSQHIQNYFNTHGYTVVKNAITLEMVNLLYRYSGIKVARTDYLRKNAPENYRPSWDGIFGDSQIPNSYNSYGDPLMDTLMTHMLPTMQSYVGFELAPTYSYWRLYQNGDELIRHIDRGSCEISTTICLGYDSDYQWPLFIKDKLGNETPVNLAPGDMIIYKGCELQHWREPFKGNQHAQVFLHYNTKNKENNNYLDGRLMLAVPHSIKK